MNSITWQERSIPVRGDYDVIVVGGGVSGTFAGIASSRRSCRTLIIEQFGSLGGSATEGLVLPLMSTHMPNYRGHCPLSTELVERLRKVGGCEEDDYYFDGTIMKIILEQMVLESGCKLLYYTSLVDVIKTGNRISYIIVHNKDGFSAFHSTCFIDCTGDADLAVQSGVEYDYGNSKHINQPVSLRFEMAGINYSAFFDFMENIGGSRVKYFAMNTPGMKDLLQKAVSDGTLTQQDAVYFQAFGIPGRPDAMNFNCPELTTKANVVDTEFMTQKQVEGKAAILRLRTFLRNYIPGFKNAYITSISQMVGFRESRRIQSEYILTIYDILQFRKFPDGIAATHYPVDIHGEEDVTLGLKYDDTVPIQERYWEIPYRTMVPLGIDNLLVAGRCAGMDFKAQSAARIQPICRSMGEAAGIAAFQYLQEGISAFREVDGIKVRKEINLPEKL